MAEKIEVGGLTFDGASIDALLDDDPNVSSTVQDTDEREQPDSKTMAAEDADSRMEADTEAEANQDEDQAESDEAEPEEDDTTSDEDEKKGPDETVEFIVDGDEGPQLLTGYADDNTPVYETADEIFGDHKFKIKAAGNEHEVTFDEMRKGYQRQVDYTQGKTKIAETQRAMQPYIALLTLWEKDGAFRDTITNYIDGAKAEEVSNDDILQASESGDSEKLKALLAKRDGQTGKRKAMQAADAAAQQQRQQFAAQQHDIAKSLIPSYNDTVPKVKQFLTNLGYGDHEVNGYEYMDARLQNLAYLAYKQANPNSTMQPDKDPGNKTLQSKARRIVRRPPKAVKAATGQANTPQARTSRKAQAAFKRAYKTQNRSDFAAALEASLPDDLLDD